MTSPALTLALALAQRHVRERQALLSREASRHPMLEQTPYREAEVDLMNEEAALKLVIADQEKEK